MIRRLARRNYFVSKRYALARMKRREPPVVVFSMGKTGSTAVARALEEATGDRVFQIFRLEAERLAQAERRYRARNREARRRGDQRGANPFPGALHLWESAYLLRHPPTRAAPWTVVTTVREPIAQAVSAFFHAGTRSAAGTAPTPDALVAAMVEDGWIRAPLQWFDREFAPALGIDVLAHPFDPGRGSGAIETPAARVLLIRQENLASAASVGLEAFLGLPAPVAVPVRNQATTKSYAGPYRDFLASVRIPARVLDEVYASRYARHFYADNELMRFRERWSGGAGG